MKGISNKVQDVKHDDFEMRMLREKVAFLEGILKSSYCIPSISDIPNVTERKIYSGYDLMNIMNKTVEVPKPYSIVEVKRIPIENSMEAYLEEESELAG